MGTGARVSDGWPAFGKSRGSGTAHRPSGKIVRSNPEALLP
jgi:hypothetical protein